MHPDHVDITLQTMVKHAFTLSEGTVQWIEPNRLELRAVILASVGDTIELRPLLPDSQRRIYARLTIESVVPDVDDVLVVCRLDEIPSDDEIWLERWLRTQLPPGETQIPRFGTRPRPKPATPGLSLPPPVPTAPTLPTHARPVQHPTAPAVDPVIEVDSTFSTVTARWRTKDALYRDWYRQLRHRRVEVPWEGDPPPIHRTVRVTLDAPGGLEVLAMAEVVDASPQHVRLDLTLFPDDREALATAAGAS